MSAEPCARVILYCIGDGSESGHCGVFRIVTPDKGPGGTLFVCEPGELLTLESGMPFFCARWYPCVADGTTRVTAVNELTDISCVLKTGPSIRTLQALMFFVWTKHLPPCAFRVALEDSARLEFMFAEKRRLVLAAVTTRGGLLTLFISSKHASIFLRKGSACLKGMHDGDE